MLEASNIKSVSEDEALEESVAAQIGSTWADMMQSSERATCGGARRFWRRWEIATIKWRIPDANRGIVVPNVIMPVRAASYIHSG